LPSSSSSSSSSSCDTAKETHQWSGQLPVLLLPPSNEDARSTFDDHDHSVDQAPTPTPTVSVPFDRNLVLDQLVSSGHVWDVFSVVSSSSTSPGFVDANNRVSVDGVPRGQTNPDPRKPLSAAASDVSMSIPTVDVVQVSIPNPTFTSDPDLIIKLTCPSSFPSSSNDHSPSPLQLRRCVMQENLIWGTHLAHLQGVVVPRWHGLWGGLLPRLGTVFGGESEVWMALVDRVGREVKGDEARGRLR